MLAPSSLCGVWCSGDSQNIGVVRTRRVMRKIAGGQSRAGVSNPFAENMGIQLTHLEWPKLDGNIVGVTKMKQEIVGSLIGSGLIRPWKDK